MSNSMNVLNSEIQRIGSINAPAGAVTITVAESGTHFLCTPAGTSRTITLPNPATAGLTYTFTKVGAVAHPLVFALGAHVGTIIRAKSDGTLGSSIAAGTTSITMAATAVIGDFIKVTSTGTNWVVVASSQSAGVAGITSI